MKILMVRHPVSVANVLGAVEHNLQGELDIRGYEQIEKLVKHLEKTPLDNLYSSDAFRCSILAEEIAKSRGIEVKYSELFREIDNGDLSGRKKDEIDKFRLENHLGVPPPNGESLLDLEKRARAGLQLIVDNGGYNNLLVSHGWFLKMFLGIQIGMDPRQSIQQLKFSNCAVSEVSIRNGNCIIEYLNNRDYLR